MIELDNAIEFYRNKTGHTTEQEQEILRQMDEEKKVNPLSPENLDKNIVLIKTLTEDLGMMGLVTLQNDNQLGELVMSLMLQNNDLATMVMNLQTEVETLKGN